MITQQEFAKRREQVFSQMHDNSIAIIFAATEKIRNAKQSYPYRQDSNFYYLTGFCEPEAVALLIKTNQQTKFILFNRPRDEKAEQWDNCRAGQKGAIDDFGADESYPIDQLNEQILQLINRKQYIYYFYGYDLATDSHVSAWLNNARAVLRREYQAAPQIINLDTIVHELRLIKSAEEINLMKAAAKITAQAHKHVMQICQPQMYEYQIAAELLSYYHHHGAREVAFAPIIGSGNNACIMHYTENNQLLENDRLVLVDSGCEFQYYAADVTRTFPINGKFRPEQQAIYDIVLSAQLEAIKQIKPGCTFEKCQSVATQIIVNGLLDLGILTGNANEIIASKTYQQFYMTNIGHWIGLDVHDAGNYKINDVWRKFEPGMVITIEPGIYISANHNIDKQWWGIGVRIEDEIVITENGHEVITADAPK